MDQSSVTVFRAGATMLGVGCIWYGLCEAIAAYGFPGYNYATNWISDLGVTEPSVFQGRTIDSKLAVVMNAGVIGEGLLFILGAVLIFWALPRSDRRITFLTLALIHGFGVALVGFVSGSQENQDAGFAVLHVGGALSTIIAGNVVMILAGTSFLRDHVSLWISRACVFLGATGLVSLAILIITAIAGSKFAPVWERGSVYSILVSCLLISGGVIARRSAEERG